MSLLPAACRETALLVDDAVDDIRQRYGISTTVSHETVNGSTAAPSSAKVLVHQVIFSACLPACLPASCCRLFLSQLLQWQAVFIAEHAAARPGPALVAVAHAVLLSSIFSDVMCSTAATRP
jgi:hypothetical protein